MGLHFVIFLIKICAVLCYQLGVLYIALARPFIVYILFFCLRWIRDVHTLSNAKTEHFELELAFKCTGCYFVHMAFVELIGSSNIQVRFAISHWLMR